MKKILAYFGFAFLFFWSAFAFADATPAAEDPSVVLNMLLQVYNAIKTGAPVAVIIVAIVQVLKTAPVIGILSKLEGKYLQITVAILTTLGFVADAVVKGQSWGAAAITGLFTSGGAMLIYEGYKAIKS